LTPAVGVEAIFRQATISRTSASPAFAITDWMPFSIAAADDYDSLTPITWWFPALSTKYGCPCLSMRRSNRLGSPAFFLTAAIPDRALRFRM
jgi:hypothetical protein